MFPLDEAHKRLDKFILSAGNTRERTTHKRCASHNGRVPARGTVESQCRAIARYVSFRRNGNPDSYAAGLCEVVVIGHRHISKYVLCIHDHFDEVKDINTCVYIYIRTVYNYQQRHFAYFL